MFSYKIFSKITLLIFLIIILLYLKYKSTEKIEPFKNNNIINENFIQQMLNSAKKEINFKKENWLTYIASKKDGNYIITSGKNNDVLYKMEISKSNNKNVYIVKSLDKKINDSQIISNLTQDDNTPNSYGSFEKNPIKIEFKKNEERITILINNETTIIGYGGFSNNNIYPSPWYQVLPIVYKEGNSVIGTMDFVSDIKKLKSSSEDIPVEIIVSKENQRYLPLFFKIYVLTQKYISSIK